MTNTAKIVHVQITDGEAELIHATSPDEPELFVSGHSVDELIEAVPVVLSAIYKAHGRSVVVVGTEATEPDKLPPWVIVPNERLKALA